MVGLSDIENDDMSPAEQDALFRKAMRFGVALVALALLCCWLLNHAAPAPSSAPPTPASPSMF